MLDPQFQQSTYFALAGYKWFFSVTLLHTYGPVTC